MPLNFLKSGTYNIVIDNIENCGKIIPDWTENIGSGRNSLDLELIKLGIYTHIMLYHQASNKFNNIIIIKIIFVFLPDMKQMFETVHADVL